MREIQLLKKLKEYLNQVKLVLLIRIYQIHSMLIIQIDTLQQLVQFKVQNKDQIYLLDQLIEKKQMFIILVLRQMYQEIRM